MEYLDFIRADVPFICGVGVAWYSQRRKTMKKETEEEKKTKQEGCRHLFALSRIDTEQRNQGVGSTGYFYQRVAYVVCEKCGEVRKQLI